MNIRYVRNKIRSVTNVQKITRAMQLVSAVKMKKAQSQALEGKPYQNTLDRIMSKVSRAIDVNLSPLFQDNPKAANRDLIIVVTSNKGLCGAYNFYLLRHILNNASMANSDFITIGKKGAQFISRTKGNIVADFSGDTSLNSVSSIVDFAISGFLEGKYKKVYVYYNFFISSLRTEPTSETILPMAKFEQNIKEESEEYAIEPEPSEMIDELLRSYIEEKLRYILIQNEAGEHSARMIAMKNATDNATELIDNLTLVRNKLRQQKITYELLDMITAKESVEQN